MISPAAMTLPRLLGLHTAATALYQCVLRVMSACAVRGRENPRGRRIGERISAVTHPHKPPHRLPWTHSALRRVRGGGWQAGGKGARRDDKAESSGKAQQKLSREYIAQRADVDEPIQGFVVRTRQHDWMQGFVWWTPFTTWTHFFRWDSLATQCGMRRGPVRLTTSPTHPSPQPSPRAYLSRATASPRQLLPF
jgi:hypothetical protein